MSLFSIRESEEIKQNKLRKVISLKHAFSSNQAYGISTTVFNNSKIPTDLTKQGDGASKPVGNRQSMSAGQTRKQIGDTKLPKWHYQMEQAFENFLLKLDDIFITLRRDAPKEMDLSDYKDICEKLRTETLIAMDRLEFVALPDNNLTGEKSAFIEKLNAIKGQLSALRWQYHTAIKELGAR